jgi:hypothetical protein
MQRINLFFKYKLIVQESIYQLKKTAILSIFVLPMAIPKTDFHSKDNIPADLIILAIIGTFVAVVYGLLVCTVLVVFV